MYQFFIGTEEISENEIIISNPEDVNHIYHVLRMRIGEKIRLCCDNGNDYICHIEEMNAKEIHAVVEDVERESRELPVKLVLFQGLAKGDKMETIIQKAVELGVHEVVPVSTHRSVVKLDAKRGDKKVVRWNAISKSAAKQSGRNYIPQVKEIMTFAQALDYAKTLDYNLVPYEEAKGISETRILLEKVKEYTSAGIFIGPEGGFEKTEIAKAMEIGAHPITLGHRILRTETAGMTILSILMFMLEEDDNKGEE